MAKLYLGSVEVTPVVSKSTDNVLTTPDYSNKTTLAVGQLHTINTTGWIASSGSVRLDSNTGLQLCTGSAYTTVPIAGGSKVYVSGAQAFFFPCSERGFIMPTTTNVAKIKLNVMTRSQYLGTTVNPNEFYMVTDAYASMFKLFEFKWTDYTLTDLSWVRADDFSWLDGTVYTDAYAHLTSDISGKTATSETVGSYTISYYLADDGHKITTDETNAVNIYNESGIAWYYILDTTNQKFKVPRTKWGFVGYRDTVGKYIKPGLPNITGSVGGMDRITAGAPTGCFYEISGTTNSGATTSNSRANIGLNASRSSSIYGQSTTVQPPATQMYLYFYVGKFSQTATEQTAGLNANLFNGKVDLNGNNATFPHIVEAYKSGTDWYCIWSNKYVEQGGHSTNFSGTDSTVSVTLLVPLADTKYSVLATHDNCGYKASIYSSGKTTTTFNLRREANSNVGAKGADWRATGYKA